MTRLSIIVAMDENRLIGAGNALPWHLPADLAFFRRTTLGKPVIMGRKTHQSIGRPLPGRRNIVVSRNARLETPGCELADGLEAALALCRGDDEAMLIGGAELYRQGLPLASRMYITLIHACFSGDAWFPAFDASQWRIEWQRDFDADEANSSPYSLLCYTRSGN